MTQNQRFRRLTDLFVDGKAVPLPDGTHLWVQVINSYEREECISDAQTARARLILALREAGAERVKVEGRYAEKGHDAMAQDLARTKVYAKQGEIGMRLRDDPEWKERCEILMRTDVESAAAPLQPEEQTLLDKINAEVLAELDRREADERDYLLGRYQRMDEKELIDEWVEEWLDRRGTDLATQEFRLTELWYATRYCDAVADQDGKLDHTRCAGHRTRVFDTKPDARAAPDKLQSLLREALDTLQMAAIDPKDSGSPESSSASSRTPSEPEESTSSTSTPAPSSAPGT